MNAIGRLFLVGLAAAAALGAWRATAAGAALARVSGEVEREHRGQAMDVPLAGVRVLRLRPGGGADTLELGGQDRAVLFAYDAACSACNQNMWNWIDVVREAGDGARGRFYAITVMPPREAAAYWRGLRGDVQVLVTDTPTIARRLRTVGPPATLLVEGGRVRRQYHGLLDERAKREIARAVAGP